MNILALSQNPWDDRNAIGNTYSNWFGGEEWKDDSFSNVYSRVQNPRNSVCKDYYRVTDIEILKKLFCPERIGQHYEYEAVSETHESGELREQKLISALHRHSFHPVYFIQEALRLNGRWVNRRFVEYIKDFDPDIVFTFASGTCLPRKLYDCIRERTKAKIVVFVSDDMCEKYRSYPWYRRRPLLEGFKWTLQHADRVFGASELLCREYGKVFGIDMTPLYKGCKLMPLQTKQTDGVLRIVYAGNLLYGRDDTLAALANSLAKINQSTPQAMLEIYTGTTLTPESEKKLNISGSSKIMGRRPYTEIENILNHADVVLHVESFEKKQIDYVHFSFSTKIADCLQSGSTALAIGPAGIASIEYFCSIPGAWIIDDLSQMNQVMQEMISHRGQLPIDAKKSREFAVQHHDIHHIRTALRNNLEELITS